MITQALRRKAARTVMKRKRVIIFCFHMASPLYSVTFETISHRKPVANGGLQKYRDHC